MSLSDKLVEVLTPALTYTTGTFTTVAAGASVVLMPGAFDISINNKTATTAWTASVVLERSFEPQTTSTTLTTWRKWTTYSTVMEAVITAGSWCKVRMRAVSGVQGKSARWAIRQGK